MKVDLVTSLLACPSTLPPASFHGWRALEHARPLAVELPGMAGLSCVFLCWRGTIFPALLPLAGFRRRRRRCPPPITASDRARPRHQVDSKPALWTDAALGTEDRQRLCQRRLRESLSPHATQFLYPEPSSLGRPQCAGQCADPTAVFIVKWRRGGGGGRRQGGGGGGPRNAEHTVHGANAALLCKRIPLFCSPVSLRRPGYFQLPFPRCPQRERDPDCAQCAKRLRLY